MKPCFSHTCEKHSALPVNAPVRAKIVRCAWGSRSAIPQSADRGGTAGISGEKFSDDELNGRYVRWVIWSSEQAHLVDALAAEGDEGRCSLR